jgi:CubicO group peptidase (beta-lactamase class C family)
MNTRKKYLEMVFVILMFLVILAGCSTHPGRQYEYQIPEETDDGLRTKNASEIGMNVSPLEEAVNSISSGRYGEVHSLLIIKDGKLVLEEYFAGHKYKWDGPNFHGTLVTWDRPRKHTVMSVGKSMTSASVGIAVDQGYIESVNQSIFKYLPDHQHLKRDGKGEITIEDLLTMTSGLEWKEWGYSYGDENNDVINLWLNCDDQIACILEKQLVHEPGTQFDYNGGNTVLLAEIVKTATGMDLEAFSAKYLYEPLGIEPPTYQRFDSGVVDGSGAQKMTPREMAKFGLLYLNQGLWDGKQVISPEWIEKSAVSNPNINRFSIPGTSAGRLGYSYTWYTKNYRQTGDMYFAFGFGGQCIMVFPDEEMVVVFTAGNYGAKTTSFNVLEKYILPSLN